MSGFLIDTNVLSEYAKPVPNPQVLLWFERTDPNALYASVITFGEILFGIEDLAFGKRRSELELWLRDGLPRWFGARSLQVTNEIAARWGKLTAQAKRRGLTLHTLDGLIAATALEHDLALVTRNVKDFDSLGCRIVNPWADTP